MMSYPRVSLFHMFYNQLDGVVAAVEASFAQDYPNLEIVISDDASTDGTFELLQKMVDDYDGPHDVVLLQNSENRGIVGNFNTLLDRTTGDYVVQTNGDDISFPHRVSTIVDVFQSDPEVMLAYSPVILLDREGKRGDILYDKPDSAYDISPGDFLINAVSQTGACSSYNRRVFDQFGPISTHAVYEDRIMPFRAHLLGKIKGVKEPLLYFRIGGTSWRSGTEEEKRRFDRHMLNTRVGDARAFLAERHMYDFPGKGRVTLFCYLNIFRSKVLGTPFEGLMRPLTSREMRKRVRGMLSRGSTAQ